MNVTGLWDMGIAGHGAVTAFVDNRLNYESKDLMDNFVSPHTASCLHTCA